MRVIPVVVKIAAPGLTKIPVSDQVGFLSSRFTARSDRRRRLFQKIDAGASGLIVTMTMDKKTDRIAAPPRSVEPRHAALREVRAPACWRNIQRSPKFNFIGVPRTGSKLKVENGAAGETTGKLNHSLRRRNHAI
jgi:hypothetical protein